MEIKDSKKLVLMAFDNKAKNLINKNLIECNKNLIKCSTNLDLFRTLKDLKKIIIKISVKELQFLTN